MKSFLTQSLVFLGMLAVGVLYYIVLFGDVPELVGRIALLEKRVDSLVRRDGGEEVAGVVDVVVNSDKVVLSEQQMNQIAGQVAASVTPQMANLIAKQVQEEIDTRVGDKAGIDFYIPMGRAVLKTPDNNWQDTGLQAEVDMSRFVGQVVVYLEGTMHIPTGNGQVELRLLDSQTGVVSGSEMSVTGSKGVFVRSGQLSLGEGVRVVKVQMRTSLDYEGVADGVRLRFVMQ